MAEVGPVDIEGLLVAWVPAHATVAPLLTVATDPDSPGSRVATLLPAPVAGVDQWPRVRVTRVGGAVDNVAALIDRPLVQVEVFGDDAPGGWLTSHDIGAAILAALITDLPGTRVAGFGWVTGVDQSGGLVRSPDPNDERPRWLFTVQITAHR